jgi:segregation and condensation protein A
MTEPYRVDLEIYNGPLDLLLYLIRRNEVDIHDIPIAAITEQYLSYMEAIQVLEPGVAGDFLVMAATLMEIKSRMLLPKPPPEEEEAEDPRSELVRQLLEYKRYKDAAGWLGEQAEARAERFGRLEAETPQGAPRDPDADLKDVELWDLVEAFGRLMRETLAAVPGTIVDEDVPVQTLTERILERLRREGEVPFTSLFDGQPSRRYVVSVFLAILELVRLRRIRAVQNTRFGEILVRLRGPEVVGTET